MNAADLLALVDGVSRWGSIDCTNPEREAWAETLEPLPYEPARQVLEDIRKTQPHRRPSVEQFVQTLDLVLEPARLSADQIARNLAHLAGIRAQLKTHKETHQ